MANSLAVDPISIGGPRKTTDGDFARWMTSEQRRVYLLCCRLLGDSDEAESATQDIFFKAHTALGRPGEPELRDPTRWLTRIAVNTCLDRLRSQRWQFWKRRPKPENEALILAMAPATAPTAEDRLYAAEIHQRLFRALRQLSDRQRAVFTLKHFEDRSLEEIAAILDLDLGTVKAHMSRALVKLRASLKDLYGRPAL